MTKFADQLLDDLVREHGSTLAHAAPPAARRRHIASRRTLVATGTGFVAIVATVGGLMASGGGTPAYALTTHSNGTVTLDVYQVAGIAGINTKLHQVGDDQVVVVPVKSGCPAMSSLPAPIVPPSGHISVQTGGSVTGGSVTVNARGIPAGDILVVAVETTTTATGHYSMGAGRLTTPPAPSCVSLPAPPAVGGGGSGSSSGSVSG